MAPETNSVIEASASANVTRRPQLALFEGATAASDSVAVYRRYSEAMIAQALMESRGVVTQAARLLSSDTTHCSPTTINKRLKNNPRLREVRRLGREVLKDNSTTLIADSIEAPCVYCGEPLLTSAQRREKCGVRPEPTAAEVEACRTVARNAGRAFDEFGLVRHESFSELDTVERIRLATWYLKMEAEREGVVADFPEDLSKLSKENLIELKRRIAARQPIDDLLLLARAS